MNTDLTDKISPFFFGPASQQLFGLYHAPYAGQERDFGVLICNPWGQEFIRAHRSISQLGLRLARAGFPVLRFDFTGAGDSAGADDCAGLAQWQADIRAAIQELKRRARVESVFIAGLRLGASLAGLVASGRDDVEGLVLWEPVVAGEEYLRDLESWQEEKEMYFFKQPGSSGDELLGFSLHPGLLDELRGLNLLALKRRPAADVLIIESNAPDSGARPSVQRLCEHLQGLGANTEYRRVESFKMWVEDPDKALVPQAVLEAAVNWLAGAAA
ncbi:MAG TPA: alpha/beta hydrolase [Anaerolineaceae bacterium]